MKWSPRGERRARAGQPGGVVASRGRAGRRRGRMKRTVWRSSHQRAWVSVDAWMRASAKGEEGKGTTGAWNQPQVFGSSCSCLSLTVLRWDPHILGGRLKGDKELMHPQIKPRNEKWSVFQHFIPQFTGIWMSRMQRWPNYGLRTPKRTAPPCHTCVHPQLCSEGSECDR